MLIKDVPIADMSQLFHGTIMFYKKQNRWVYVSVMDGAKVKVMFLDDRTSVITKLSDENFSTEAPKLGMVNTNLGCAYASRIPKRVMKAALCADTMAVHKPFVDREVWTGAGVVEVMRSFSSDIVKTLLGEYPSFVEACSMVKAHIAYAVAFDRQFCVSYKGAVYYKANTVPVGNIDLAGDVPFHIDNIVWKDGMQPLKLVIGDNCGKALQAFKSAPKQRIVRD